jgi:hypothetical protein
MIIYFNNININRPLLLTFPRNRIFFPKGGQISENDIILWPVFHSCTKEFFRMLLKKQN